MCNCDEYKSIGISHLIALYMWMVIIWHILIALKFNIFQMKLKITTNIYRVQANDSIIRGYFCNVAYVINYDKCKSVETHWIALYVKYFNIFWVEYIPKDIKRFIGNKNVTTNINRIQANDSIICWYFLLD